MWMMSWQDILTCEERNILWQLERHGHKTENPEPCTRRTSPSQLQQDPANELQPAAANPSHPQVASQPLPAPFFNSIEVRLNSSWIRVRKPLRHWPIVIQSNSIWTGSFECLPWNHWFFYQTGQKTKSTVSSWDFVPKICWRAYENWEWHSWAYT